MAYLKCNKIIHESLKTFGKQSLYALSTIIDPDTYLDDDASWDKYMRNKREQFDENFIIKPSLKNKLVSWVKKIPNILLLSRNEMDRFLSASNTDKRATDTGSYDYYERNEVSAQKKARISNGYNGITNATCSYRLDVGGGKEALLLFTFDSDEIKVCQTIVRNDYSSGGLLSGMQAVKIPEWNSVAREEYLK